MWLGRCIRNDKEQWDSGDLPCKILRKFWNLPNGPREVVDESELAACCRKHAKDLLQLSPKGLRLTKWLLNNSQDSHRAENQDYTCQ